MTITKIITHAGQFHADEILACALLRVLGFDAPIERTYTPSESDFADPAVFVLDVGQRYEPEKGNFDHHQDSSLESTNVLILRHVADKLGVQVADQLYNRLFCRVSDVDRGKIVYSDDNPSPEFNMIIRAFNNLDDGFNRALAVATEILNAQIETICKYLNDLDRWHTLEKNGGVAIQHDTEVILCWKEKAKEEGIWLLVCPNLRGGYSVVSRDTSELVIPVDEYQTFCHASGFMATYPSFQIALQQAKTLL